MSEAVRPYIQAIWIGIAIQIAGRIRDGIWHANNDEFEAASQQLEAHWILWLGVVGTLAVAALAVARLPEADRNPGFAALVGFCAFYVAVAIWHFIEHANYNDPELPHVLLAIGQIGIIAAAAAATLLARRRARFAA